MIRGIVTIEVKDSKTEEIVQTIVKENTLTDIQKSWVIGLSGSGIQPWPGDATGWSDFFGGPIKIYIYDGAASEHGGRSLTKEHPGLSSAFVGTSIVAPGTILANQYGFAGLSWDISTNPALGEIVCRFEPGANDRSFYHVVLGGSTSVTHKAYITLDEPCIQLGPPNSQIIDITYRLYWDTTADITENYDEDMRFENRNAFHQLRTGGYFRILNVGSVLGWSDSVILHQARMSRSHLSKFPTIDAPATSNTAYNFFELQLPWDSYFGSDVNDNGFSRTLLTHGTNLWGLSHELNWERESNKNGQIIQGILTHPHGYHSILPANNILSDTTNYKMPIQVIHNHNANAVRPFIDPDYLANAPGVPSANGAAWTNPDFPKMYRVDIRGDSNTALGTTYQFAVRDTVGFGYAGGALAECYWDVGQQSSLSNLRNWGNSTRSLSMKNMWQATTPWNAPEFNIPYAGVSGIKAATNNAPKWETGINVHNWSNVYAWEMFNYYSPLARTHLISHNWTGITVTQYLKGWFWNYDTARDSNMDFQYLTQVVADANNNLWCADRLTGLTRISDILVTATANNITSAQNSIPAGGNTGCYGVCLTANNRIYAIFENGLSYTDNPTNDDPSTIVFNTDSNFTLFPGTDRQLIVGLKGDPQHPNNHIAVVSANNTYIASDYGGRADYTGFAMDLHWYDGSTGETQKCLDQGVPPLGDNADNLGVPAGNNGLWGASATHPNGRPAYEASQQSGGAISTYQQTGDTLSFNYYGQGSAGVSSGRNSGDSNIAVNSEHHHQWVNCSQIGSTWMRARFAMERSTSTNSSNMTVISGFMNKAYSSGVNIYRPNGFGSESARYNGHGMPFRTTRWPMIDAHGVPRYSIVAVTANDPPTDLTPEGNLFLQSISGICSADNVPTAGTGFDILGQSQLQTYNLLNKPMKGPAPPRSGLVIGGETNRSTYTEGQIGTRIMQEESVPINRDIEVQSPWNGKNVGRSMIWRRYGWTGAEWQENYGQPFADSAGANNAVRIGFDFNSPLFVGDNYIDASSVFPTGGNGDWNISSPDATFAFKIKRDQIDRDFGNNPQVLFEYFEPNSDNRIVLYVDDLVPMYTVSPRDQSGILVTTYDGVRKNFWQCYEGNTAIRVHSKNYHTEARISAANTFNTTDPYRFVLTTNNTSANLFVNGTHIGGVALTQEIDYRNTSGKAKFHIGTNSYNDYNGINLPENFYHGEIENVQVWNKEWSPTEIANDYANNAGGGLISDAGSNLKAHWLMTETLEDGKPTHFNYEGLEDGLTISFPDPVIDGFTGNSWSNGDYYTFGVVEGLMKDNANEFSIYVGVKLLPSDKFTTFKNAVTGTKESTAGAIERTESLNLVRSAVSGPKAYNGTYGSGGLSGQTNENYQNENGGRVKSTGHFTAPASEEASSWFTLPAANNTNLVLSAFCEGANSGPGFSTGTSRSYTTLALSSDPTANYKPMPANFGSFLDTNLNHAIHAVVSSTTGNIYVSENGSYIAAGSFVGGTYPTFNVGDKLSIERVAGTINYKQNDSIVYTSGSPTTTSLYPHQHVSRNIGWSNTTFTYTPPSNLGNIMFIGDPIAKTGYQDEMFVCAAIEDWDQSTVGVPHFAEIYIDGVEATVIPNNEWADWKPTTSATEVLLDETGYLILDSTTAGANVTGFVTMQYHR